MDVTRLLVPLLLLVTPAAAAANAPDRPNIVFILADDLGYGDIDAFGGDRCNIDTPHFDRVCAEGVRFTNAHVTDSVCVPSRTSIMTGRYAFRFGKAGQGGPWGFTGLRFPTTQHTLGKMLQAGGYATGYVGKWHLGTRMTTRDGKVQGPANTDFTKPIQIGASDYGFEDCFFLPGSLDMFPYAFIRGNDWQGKVHDRRKAGVPLTESARRPRISWIPRCCPRSARKPETSLEPEPIQTNRSFCLSR